MYEAGTVVAGKYRLERVLGTGGMGVVVAAMHLQLGTAVALKFLHNDLTQNPAVVERFMREARSSAQLRGENVCRVSDVGTSETGQPFIVMELLAGQDLGSVLGASGALAVPAAAEVIMQACIALGEAHQQGFVHRDIKPGNLFWTLRPDGSALIKVLDFGVAKPPEELNFSLTQTQNVIGSPGYMSPEQLKSSKTVDARSDIWSLGVVLYELVSGRKPFHAETITALALRVAMDPAPQLAGWVPASFESVILRCLEKEPQRRFNDVAELAQALAPFVGPVRGAELAYAVQRMLRGSQAPMMPAAPYPASTPTTLRGANGVVAGSGIGIKRNWRLPAIMGIGAAAGVALALVIVERGGGSASKPAAASAPSERTKMEVAPAPTPATPNRDATPAPTIPQPAAPTPTAPTANRDPTPMPTTPQSSAPAPAKAGPVVQAPVTKVPAKPTADKQATMPTKKRRGKNVTKPNPGDISDSRL